MGLLDLVWLVPLFPLVACVTIILTPVKHNKRLSAGLAIAGAMASWLLSWAIFFGAGNHAVHEAAEGHPFHLAMRWLPTGTDFFEMSVMVDGLTLAMLFMVPFVATLIFVYSVGYHNLEAPAASHPEVAAPHPGETEPRFARFFAYVSLFLAGMLTLVISGNLLLFFLAWEIMGLCSYLLIGFWFAQPAEFGRLPPRWASLKAFMTTRVGDALFFIGLMLLYSATGTLNLYELFTPERFEPLREATLSLGPLGALPLLPTIALLIFSGAVGKSAQFPLHVWLPDAMAGPTPVSAMIHAATMVAAGVFLVARVLPLFEPLEGSPQLAVVALIGAFTAFFASTIAITQNDVKGVLAYSTISQLGYMIAALGLGGLVAGVFHMLTHAFFKALLFLASGSVIHGMEHGIHALHHGHGTGHAGHGHGEHPAETHGHTTPAGAHDHDHGATFPPYDPDVAPPPAHIDPQNMWNMGGLRAQMPRTYWAFLIGGASLAGIPFITAGFWSKDEILGQAAYLASHGEMGWIPPVVLVLLTLTALMTAFYTGRQLGLTFHGAARTPEATHAHESPPWMTIPLAVLALFAVIAGFVNIPEGVVPGLSFHALGHMLEEVHHSVGIDYHPHAFNWLLALLVGGGGLLAFLGGIRLYAGATTEPLTRLGGLWNFFAHKWYLDELYQRAVVRPVVALASWLARLDADWLIDPIVNAIARGMRSISDGGRWFDTHIVDGLVNLVGRIADRAATRLRLLQTGQVQNYLVVLVAGVLALAALFWR